MEVGPHAVLGPMAGAGLGRPCLGGGDGGGHADGRRGQYEKTFRGTETRPRPESSFVDGGGRSLPRPVSDISLRPGLFAGETRCRISLPGYPFQRERLLVGARPNARRHRRRSPPAGGSARVGAGGNHFRDGGVPLRSGLVGRITVSSEGWWCRGRSTARWRPPPRWWRERVEVPVVMEDMQLHSPLVFSEKQDSENGMGDGRPQDPGGARGLPTRTSSRSVQLFSKGSEEEWTLARGRSACWRARPLPDAGGRVDPGRTGRPVCRLPTCRLTTVAKAETGNRSRTGPSERWFGMIWSGPGEAVAEVSCPKCSGPQRPGRASSGDWTVASKWWAWRAT